MGGKLLAVAQLFAASCLLLAGCSGSGRPATAPVRGQVTYQGKPVAGATVVFLCPGAPRLAVGKTDDEGNYRLTTYEPDDGATIGTHVVTVKKKKREPDASDPRVGAAGQNLQGEALSKAIEKSMQSSAREVAMTEKSGSLIPAKYSQQKTSDLRKEVIEGENVINIELSN
jgi:hypothetical protein